MKVWIFIGISLITFSCKKCSECECIKDGVTVIEKECATGINQEDGLTYWERSLTDNQGYDRCTCVRE